MDFLKDEKTLTGIVSAIMGIIVQIAGKHEFLIDAATANAITGLVVIVALGIMGSHAHVQNGEAHADGAVDAAKAAK